jgi:hypothetical protein
MNYQRIYDSIIENAKLQNRKKKQGIYYEEHHIIPKCLGGKDRKINLVLLTAKEHFVCHHLLYKANPKNIKLYYAFFCMCTINVASSLNAIDFDIVRNYYYENIGYQKKHSEEAKKKMSESRIKYFEDNPNAREELSKSLLEYYETHDSKTKGSVRGPMSEETKQKLRDIANLRFETEDGYWLGKHLSEETKQKLSITHKLRFENMTDEEWDVYMKNLPRGEDNAWFGKHHSDETKEKLRQINLGKVMPRESVERQIASLKKYYETHDVVNKGVPMKDGQKQKLSISRKEFYKNATEEDMKKIARNKPILCNGVRYDSMKDARMELNMSEDKFRRYFRKQISLGNSLYQYLDK